jgi:hypothetical protein
MCICYPILLQLPEADGIFIFGRLACMSTLILQHLLLIHNLKFYPVEVAAAVPLQACSGPEGSRKLRFPHYMTTAQIGGKVVSLTHRTPLPPGNAPGTHFC